MKFCGNRLIFLKIPKNVTGEVEIREFNNKGVSGSVLLSDKKTYRLVCREDSNTFLMKKTDTLYRIDTWLECKDLKYGGEEIVDILPEVNLSTINNKNLFMPKDKVMIFYPMTDHEYREVLKQNRSLWVEMADGVYFAKVSKKTVIEVLLLTRSLIISKETKRDREIEISFVEILPEILFQLVASYSVDGIIDDIKVKKDLINLFREESKTEEEFNRNIAINWLV